MCPPGTFSCPQISLRQQCLKPRYHKTSHKTFTLIKIVPQLRFYWYFKRSTKDKTYSAAVYRHIKTIYVYRLLTQSRVARPSSTQGVIACSISARSCCSIRPCEAMAIHLFTLIVGDTRCAHSHLVVTTSFQLFPIFLAFMNARDLQRGVGGEFSLYSSRRLIISSFLRRKYQQACKYGFGLYVEYVRVQINIVLVVRVVLLCINILPTKWDY